MQNSTINSGFFGGEKAEPITCFKHKACNLLFVETMTLRRPTWNPTKTTQNTPVSVLIGILMSPIFMGQDYIIRLGIVYYTRNIILLGLCEHKQRFFTVGFERGSSME